MSGKIVLEDFSEGDGYYKVDLAYLSKEQVEEIETLVSKWKPTDEDIKNCIGMCLTDVNEQRFKDYGTNLRDCLAWLEKQVKEANISLHENKTCKENDDSLTCENERIRKELIEYFRWNTQILNDIDNREVIAWLEKRKPSKWSEEEKKALKIACKYLTLYGNIFAGKNDYEAVLIYQTADILKSLTPQPKQEWSEEDEKNWCGIIDEIEANKSNAPDYDIETYDRFLSWLDSIKQRMGK